jgi:hypothetical protein
MRIRIHNASLLTPVGQPVLHGLCLLPELVILIVDGNYFLFFILQVPREFAALRVLPPPHHTLGQGRRQEDQVCAPFSSLHAFSSSLSLNCTLFLSACLHPLLLAFSSSLSIICTHSLSAGLHPLLINLSSSLSFIRGVNPRNSRCI